MCKIGDLVKIKPIGYIDVLPIDSDGVPYAAPIDFNHISTVFICDGMKKYFGQKARILRNQHGLIRLDVDDCKYWWNENLIEKV